MWHQFPKCGPVGERHTAQIVPNDELVLWVIDQELRCGNCLLASDETATTQAREAGDAIAAAKPEILDWMDAGVRQIDQQISTTEAAQITDKAEETADDRREP